MTSLNVFIVDSDLLRSAQIILKVGNVLNQNTDRMAGGFHVADLPNVCCPLCCLAMPRASDLSKSSARAGRLLRTAYALYSALPGSPFHV